jgi:hypothetical protein
MAHKGTVDSGQWTMDNGQWTMDNGQLTMLILCYQLSTVNS